MNEVTSFITADSLALLIAATLNAGTVVALAALGLLLNERAGVLNLGAEGMMLVAAIAGFATGVATGNDWLAFGAGALAGAVMAGVFGLLVIWLNTNQYATGLAPQSVRIGPERVCGHPLHARAPARATRISTSPGCLTCLSWARPCSSTTRWSTSRCCWRSA
jgi:ABC-type uncharacterized transport system permease subunit